MIPLTLSASSLQVAELCLARFNAEYGQFGKTFQGNAASLGSSIHGAFEAYVKACYIEKKLEPTLANLLLYYQMSYMKTFGTADMEGPEYEDGLDLIKRWHKRTVFEHPVIEVEVKKNFEVPFPNGDKIKLNYIFDRLDQPGPTKFKVVDYKSQRLGLSPQDLDAKIQARIYGLAVQIEYPEAEEIWVEFDLLRHDTIGMRFTKDDNIATWKWLKRAAQRIYEFEFDPAEPRKSETLNPDCKWCVRKVTCDSVNKNAAAGGIFTLADVADAVDRRANLKYQMDAAKQAMDEIDKIIMAEAQQLDVLEFQSGTNQLNIGVSSRRSVDADMVENVVGPTLFAKYGSKGITMKDVDGLMKSSELTEEQKKELKNLIYMKIGEPTVKVSKRSSLEGK